MQGFRCTWPSPSKSMSSWKQSSRFRSARLRPSEHLVEHAGRPGGVDTPAVMDTHVEQFARVDIDDEQRLEPDALGRLHPEEVEGPEGVLGRSAHAVEADLAARCRWPKSIRRLGQARTPD